MFILGIDVGTTGTKAIAVNNDGQVAGTGYCEYSLQTPEPNRVEQNAEDWWNAAVKAVRSATELIDKDSVTAISLSTQGASMLAVDENSNPICPVITWMDRRAARESNEIIAALGYDTLYQKTGWAPEPALDAAKIAWLRRHCPDIFARAYKFVSTIEFMNFRLTGRCISDPTNAAIRQLIDIKTAQYDEDILAFLGLNKTRLPELQPSGTLVGDLTSGAAREMGLKPSVKVYNGAHDQYCAAIGSGVYKSGDMLLATGTTWVVLGVTEKLLYTKSYLSPGLFPVSGQFASMASLVSAGSALKWWTSISGDDYASIDREAASRINTASELLFYPFVAGAGCMHNENTTAQIDGFTFRHDKYDFARALMEGVAFETRIILEEFARQNMPIHKLMMTGGAAKSRLWSEITGYVTGCRIVHTKESEAACLGAAMLAAIGEGWYHGLEDSAEVMVSKRTLDLPDNGQRDFYNEKFNRYCARWKA